LDVGSQWPREGAYFLEHPEHSLGNQDSRQGRIQPVINKE